MFSSFFIVGYGLLEELKHYFRDVQNERILKNDFNVTNDLYKYRILSINITPYY